MEKEVILFDLGGVLADLGDPVADMRLEISSKTFWEVWLGSQHVRSFETGQLSAEQFVPLIAQELRVSDPQSFHHRFRNWRLKLFDGARALIDQVSAKARVALLSNTNDIHWEQIESQSQLSTQFDELFLSYKTGQYKPDPEAFRTVVSTMNCAPSKILFFDDSEKNVTAARAIGIDARLVSGIHGARRELVNSA